MTDLIDNLLALAPNEGFNCTSLPGVGVFKASETSGRVPLCYNQGVILMAQGQKRVYLGDQTYHYNPDNYLVLTLPLPAECETIVTQGEPLLSMVLDFDSAMLGELVRLYDEHHMAPKTADSDGNKGLFVSEYGDELKCVVERLSTCLRTPLHAAALGKGLVREILFHLLQGPQAASLFALASHNTHLARLERAIKYLNEHYQQKLDVEQLAQLANMSPSSFHRNFRQMTSTSPIQYIKKIRLTRARQLLTDQGIKVKQAAIQVGYDSPTQFSREFKRYFGLSPQDCGRSAAQISA
ncbi:AraC family transcriptional regulator [Bacterioplanes sanyensis]|uniref:AraC family transcriptional regulator n=1 Tax=Bacterioplanes sanyensis TaxID=1249553 RepID=A0A222FLH3_9GAMM|nr:AraC family transcriptional regulator [Bacterioplanes sanyensis]ASP39522.1 AraC family transcriptional regulator [Bacterioplanes sanyensis]